MQDLNADVQRQPFYSREMLCSCALCVPVCFSGNPPQGCERHESPGHDVVFLGLILLKRQISYPAIILSESFSV